MKRFALAAAVALLATAALAAEPIEGLWQTEVEHGTFAFVAIKPCGGTYCGTVVKEFKNQREYNSPNVGKQIVRSMSVTGSGTYEGEVWRPSNDKIYHGTAVVEGATMKLSGCVADGLICKSEIWIKLK